MPLTQACHHGLHHVGCSLRQCTHRLRLQEGSEGIGICCLLQGMDSKADDDDEEEPCELCGEAHDKTARLECDGCLRAFHMGCLDPPIMDIPAVRWMFSMLSHFILQPRRLQAARAFQLQLSHA